jgi:hypothetical protein
MGGRLGGATGTLEVKCTRVISTWKHANKEKSQNRQAALYRAQPRLLEILGQKVAEGAMERGGHERQRCETCVMMEEDEAAADSEKAFITITVKWYYY